MVAGDVGKCNDLGALVGAYSCWTAMSLGYWYLVTRLNSNVTGFRACSGDDSLNIYQGCV